MKISLFGTKKSNVLNRTQPQELFHTDFEEDVLSQSELFEVVGGIETKTRPLEMVFPKI